MVMESIKMVHELELLSFSSSKFLKFLYLSKATPFNNNIALDSMLSSLTQLFTLLPPKLSPNTFAAMAPPSQLFARVSLPSGLVKSLLSPSKPSPGNITPFSLAASSPSALSTVSALPRPTNYPLSLLLESLETRP